MREWPRAVGRRDSARALCRQDAQVPFISAGSATAASACQALSWAPSITSTRPDCPQSTTGILRLGARLSFCSRCSLHGRGQAVPWCFQESTLANGNYKLLYDLPGWRGFARTFPSRLEPCLLHPRDLHRSRLRVGARVDSGRCSRNCARLPASYGRHPQDILGSMRVFREAEQASASYPQSQLSRSSFNPMTGLCDRAVLLSLCCAFPKGS